MESNLIKFLKRYMQCKRMYHDNLLIDLMYQFGYRIKYHESEFQITNQWNGYAITCVRSLWHQCSWSLYGQKEGNWRITKRHIFSYAIYWKVKKMPFFANQAICFMNFITLHEAITTINNILKFEQTATGLNSGSWVRGPGSVIHLVPETYFYEKVSKARAIYDTLEKSKCLNFHFKRLA